MSAKPRFTEKDLKRWARQAVEKTYGARVHKTIKVVKQFEGYVAVLARKDGPGVFKVTFTTAAKGTYVSGGTVQSFLKKKPLSSKPFQIVGNKVLTEQDL